MELEHSFTVPVPRERAWDVLLDVERVAPCMPGASLDSVDGDEIHGRIKVKVGPINMTYAGTARFVERDAAAGIVKLDASGKETKGAGTASASVRSVLEDRGAETHVTVLTTLNVTGKPAQFGRGVMNEVGGKLLGIFAANLAAMLAAPEAAVAGAAAGAAPNGVTEFPTAAELTEPAGAATAPAASGAGADLDASLDDLKLAPRAASGLRRKGITTVGQLAAKTGDELLTIDGIGPASVEEIKAKLTERGLVLGQPPAAPAAAAAPAQPATAAGTGAGGAGAGAAHPTTPKAAVHQLEDDAINLLKVAGLPVLKRVIPVLLGLIAAIFIGLARKLRRRPRHHAK
ncbi:MAG TPA: SRPBCC domain-containing protein [Streptosporangiaceae bacterium]|nr:SRPBCC domain-containing protein [Streptosporangiaceae bacterium]